MIYSTMKSNRRSGMSPNDAIQETLDYCKRNGIMVDYLPYKTKEVFRMLNYAWNEEEAREALTEYGIEQGMQQGVLSSIRGLMQTMHLSATEAMDALLVPQEQRDALMALL